MESVVFVQQLRTEEYIENVASAQNGCTRTILSRKFKQNMTIARNNHNTDILHSQLCSKLYFLIYNYFMYFTLYNCMRNLKHES